MPRSLWNGAVAFAMVRVPVKLYAATESKAIRFRERHASDGAAIEHRRVCIEEDREVPYREIVKGFEAEAGRYVVLSKEEIAAADGEAARAIVVEHFVGREEIDPLYYDHAYYLGPGAGASEPYRVLHSALARSGRVAIGRFVFHNRAQLLALRAYDGVIAAHAMRFAGQLVAPAALEIPAPQREPTRGELDTAGVLVKQLSARFNPRSFRDSYREALIGLIERKAQGAATAAPPAAQDSGEEELLEALRKSLRGGSGRPPRSRAAGPRAAPRSGSPAAPAASNGGSARRRGTGRGR